MKNDRKNHFIMFRTNDSDETLADVRRCLEKTKGTRGVFIKHLQLSQDGSCEAVISIPEKDEPYRALMILVEGLRLNGYTVQSFGTMDDAPAKGAGVPAEDPDKALKDEAANLIEVYGRENAEKIAQIIRETEKETEPEWEERWDDETEERDE